MAANTPYLANNTIISAYICWFGKCNNKHYAIKVNFMINTRSILNKECFTN